MVIVVERSLESIKLSLWKWHLEPKHGNTELTIHSKKFDAFTSVIERYELILYLESLYVVVLVAQLNHLEIFSLIFASNSTISQAQRRTQPLQARDRQICLSATFRGGCTHLTPFVRAGFNSFVGVYGPVLHLQYLLYVRFCGSE